MRRALLPRSLLALALLVLAGTSCDHQKATPPAPPAAPEKLAPWTWRPVGGYIVIEGELAAPAGLILEGPHIRLETRAEAGPVRWELERPAAGERADLKTSDGKVLAKWSFGEAPKLRMRGFRQADFGNPRESPAQSESGALWAPTPGSLTAIPPLASAVVAPSLAIPTFRTSAGLLAPSSPKTPLVPAPTHETVPRVATRRSLPSPSLPRTASPFPGAGEALNLVQGPRSGKRLLLTFDGGSGAESAMEILDTLKARRVRTTFFLTAVFIQKFPHIVQRMAADGHELGNHSTTHPHMAPGMRRDPKWTRARVQAELLEADACLVELLGRPMDPYWRAPYGEHTAEIRAWAEEIGYRHVGWSGGGDSLDWATPSEKKLYRSGERILDKIHGRLQKPDGGGLIVLMHLGSGREEDDRPSKGLGAFMDRAIREGWRFVSVGDSLRELGKPAWDSSARMAWLEASSAGGSATGQKGGNIRR